MQALAFLLDRLEDPGPGREQSRLRIAGMPRAQAPGRLKPLRARSILFLITQSAT